MSNLTAERDELKSLLHGLLISSPKAMTIVQLQRDYRDQEGRDVPFRQLGYSSFLEYLRSIPNTVKLQYPPNCGHPIVIPVQSAKSSHVDALVQKQRFTARKHSKGKYNYFQPPPIRRISVKLPNSVSSSNSNNFNPDLKKKVLVPYGIQESIHSMLQANPRGLPVHVLEKQFCSNGIMPNVGICSVDHLCHNLTHLLRLENGVVYPRETQINHSISYTNSTIKSECKLISESLSLKPAGSEYMSDSLKYSATEHEQRNCSIVRSDNVDNGSKEEEYVDVLDNTECFNSTNSSADIEIEIDDHQEELLKVSGSSDHSSSPYPDSDSFVADNFPVNNVPCDSSNLINDKLKNNFQFLLDKYPNGILCSELPELYKSEFRVTLDFESLGFVSVIQMASQVNDVFYCVRLDGTDWKLFDARKEFPKAFTSRDLKCHWKESPFIIPIVPSKIQSNIERLLAFYPCGLQSTQFLDRYQDLFQCGINLQGMGFDSVESFLLSLNDTILHLRYIQEKILIYPHVKSPEPDTENPFPHLIDELFPDLYPPEVVGPKEKLSHQKLPAELLPGSDIEVMVADIQSISKFWVQFRGEDTHRALDKLMDSMQMFYNQEGSALIMSEATIRVGQYCVTQYNEEWHRACINAVPNLIEAQVVFVDYGTVGKVNKKGLLFMHKDFATLPTQAIESSLANLKPVGGVKKWPREASKRFLQLVEEKGLIGIVHKADFETHKLELFLVDTSEEEDIHINDTLVREGYAEFANKQKPQAPTKRIEENLLRSEIPIKSCSKPPPGFSKLTSLPVNTSTPSATTAESPTINPQCYMYPQMGIPNLQQNNAIPQQQQSIPSFSAGTYPNTNPLLLQQPALMNLMLYDQCVKQQQLLQSLMPNPALSVLLSQQMSNQFNAAAVLSSPLGIPLLNCPLLYPQPSFVNSNLTPAEINITEVSGNSPLVSPQTTPISKVPVSEKLNLNSSIPKVEQSFCQTNENKNSIPNTPCIITKESPTMKNQGKGNNIPSKSEAGNLRISPISILDIPNDSSTAADKSDVKVMQVKERQCEIKLNTSQRPASSKSSDISVIGQGEIAESQRVNPESQGAAQDEFSESEFIYRSDEEDEEDLVHVNIKPHYVMKVEIAKRPIHIINVTKEPYLCTDEVVRLFTEFSGRHVVLKILDSKAISVSFLEIGRREFPEIYEELEQYLVEGVPKHPSNHIIGKMHLVPLKTVPQLLAVLNVRHKEVLRGLHSHFKSFNPDDEYWKGTSTA